MLRHDHLRYAGGHIHRNGAADTHRGACLGHLTQHGTRGLFVGLLLNIQRNQAVLDLVAGFLNGAPGQAGYDNLGLGFLAADIHNNGGAALHRFSGGRFGIHHRAGGDRCVHNGLFGHAQPLVQQGLLGVVRVHIFRFGDRDILGAEADRQGHFLLFLDGSPGAGRLADDGSRRAGAVVGFVKFCL